MANFIDYNDDSIPRHAPRPSVAVVSEGIAVPTVPEVSLILDEPKSEPFIPVTTEPQQRSALPFRTYSCWKQSNTNTSPLLAINSKKQVRFDAKTVQTPGKNTPQLLPRTFVNQTSSSPSNNYESSPVYTDKERRLPISPVPIQISAVSTPTPQFQTESIAGRTISSVTVSTDVREDSRDTRYSQSPVTTLIKSPSYSSGHSFELTQVLDLLYRQNEKLACMQEKIEFLCNEVRRINGAAVVQRTIPTEDRSVQCTFSEPEPPVTFSVGTMTDPLDTTEFDVDSDSNCDSLDGVVSSPPKFKRCNPTSCGYAACKENIDVAGFHGNVLSQVKKIVSTTSPTCRKCSHPQTHSTSTSTSIVQFAGTAVQTKADVGAFNFQNLDPPYLQLRPFSSTERSLAMNALALKYLPDEKLNELVMRRPTPPEQAPLPTQQYVYQKPPTEMSLATAHYLNKYGLLNANERQQPLEQILPQNNRILNNDHFTKSPDNKFLNATAIKKQPKLL